MTKLNLNNVVVTGHDFERYTAICCSGGIGTTKTKYVGYEMVCGCELLLDRWRFCSAINPQVGEGLICGDFTKNIEKIAKLHIQRGAKGLVITLPCQSMSLAGGQHLDDPLTWLFLDALELCKMIYKLSPAHLDWVKWENCPYFISDKQDPIITNRLNGKTILQTITEVMNRLDMDVNAKVLNACFYDTAQSRKRGIILCRKLKRWEMPEPSELPLTCGEVIGDRTKFEYLDSSHRRSATNEFQRIDYVSPVQEAFIRKIKSGMSAFKCMDRSLIVNPDGMPSQAQHINSSYGRNSYNHPTHTITQGSDSLCGDWTLHPGEDLGNGEYSDPRPYSIAEIFALTGLDDNFIKAIPAWARCNDKLLRQLCGEALMPNLLAHCLSTLNK